MSRRLKMAALVFFVSVGLYAARASASARVLDSGIYYCGYGSCWLTYTDCDEPSYSDDGNGECSIVVSIGGNCVVDYSCETESFEWIVGGTGGYMLQNTPIPD